MTIGRLAANPLFFFPCSPLELIPAFACTPYFLTRSWTDLYSPKRKKKEERRRKKEEGRKKTLCSYCEHTFDLYGDHAACCIKNGNRILRHHRIRNLVDRIAQEGMLNPELEKRWILGETNGRRPGDVTLP